jgi:Tfp pilus assembly protein PilF
MNQKGPQAVFSESPLRGKSGVGSAKLSSGESAAACIATGEELENNGWDREAITVYERALNFEPNRKGISLRLARLHARVGDAEGARELFQKAVTESPKDVRVHNDFGYFLYELGDLKLAETQLRRALRLSPGDRRCQTNLALTLAAAGRFDESLKLFEKTVGPAAARSNIAVVLAQAGKERESRLMLAESKTLDPTIIQAKAAENWLDGSRATGDAERPVQPASFDQKVEDWLNRTAVGGNADRAKRSPGVEQVLPVE